MEVDKKFLSFAKRSFGFTHYKYSKAGEYTFYSPLVSGRVNIYDVTEEDEGCYSFMVTNSHLDYKFPDGWEVI